MAKGTHEYADDPRNASILVSINGALVPRDQATVSVFDSGFVFGDGVWEGLRLHGSRLVFLEDHLMRLYEGAKALDLDIGRTPDVQDPRLNSHSKLNCILACIQATKAGADEALMLDPHGFVATYNSTNFFIVRDGEVWTSTGRYCMPGITRANVLRLCAENGIDAREGDFSLSQVYGANEAFVTGTFAGIVPVVDVDGRAIGDGARGPVTLRLQWLYDELLAAEGRR